MWITPTFKKWGLTQTEPNNYKSAGPTPADCKNAGLAWHLNPD